ncbi:hypothetical protein ACFFK0_01695 [Paenibacillus chartarius]|uniref:PepSY domain-containing protein n=1 Tax=Paenibacillus chartarius TaxID=747481 RepID=A0ABV6DET9_9BACL
MRPSLWTAALLLAVGFSFALPALSDLDPGADAAAAPAAAVQAAEPASAAEPPAAPQPSAPAEQPAPESAAAAAAAQDSPPASAAAKPAVDLDDSIDRWRQALARESGFSAWKNASWTSYPLGPGTHGYIVLFVEGGKEVGYMIVGASPEGTFKLIEYGTGPRPLFSLTTLYQALVQQELIPSSMNLAEFLNDRLSRKERLYAGPMHALWKLTLNGEVVYLDAKTGEKLPADETLFPKSNTGNKPAADKAGTPGLTGQPDQAAQVQAKALLPEFDPYDRITWVTGKPLSLASFDSVKKTLSGKSRLLYVAELYDGKVTVPLAVIGYHVWSKPGDSYMAVDQDGVRYIRYDSLGGVGRFYP